MSTTWSCLLLALQSQVCTMHKPQTFAAHHHPCLPGFLLPVFSESHQSWASGWENNKGHPQLGAGRREHKGYNWRFGSPWANMNVKSLGPTQGSFLNHLGLELKKIIIFCTLELPPYSYQAAIFPVFFLAPVRNISICLFIYFIKYTDHLSVKKNNKAAYEKDKTTNSSLRKMKNLIRSKKLK